LQIDYSGTSPIPPDLPNLQFTIPIFQFAICRAAPSFVSQTVELERYFKKPSIVPTPWGWGLIYHVDFIFRKPIFECQTAFGREAS
jgi:hypothetical protein